MGNQGFKSSITSHYLKKRGKAIHVDISEPENTWFLYENQEIIYDPCMKLRKSYMILVRNQRYNKGSNTTR